MVRGAQTVSLLLFFVLCSLLFWLPLFPLHQVRSKGSPRSKESSSLYDSRNPTPIKMAIWMTRSYSPCGISCRVDAGIRILHRLQKMRPNRMWMTVVGKRQVSRKRTPWAVEQRRFPRSSLSFQDNCPRVLMEFITPLKVTSRSEKSRQRQSRTIIEQNDNRWYLQACAGCILPHRFRAVAGPVTPIRQRQAGGLTPTIL